MKKILLALLTLSTLNGFAQKKSKPEVYAKTITAADLKKHLYIIAGPEMEGRETATAGERKAAAYLEEQFKSIGLEPGNQGSYRMKFYVHQDSLANASIEIDGNRFQIDKDFNASQTNISATMAFSEVVVIGNASVDTLKNANLTGRLVLVFGTPLTMRGTTIGRGMIGTLMSKGVAGILFVADAFPSSTFANRKGNQSLSIFRRTVSPQQFLINEAMARSIMGKEYDQVKENKNTFKTFTSNILLDVKKTVISLESSNVMALLPGTDLKDEYIFITAHYDHLGKRGDSVIYYGADDDGSGTVSLIEIAEAFQKAKSEGKGPRRSIIFMAVSGEEKGLWGSEHYSNFPVFPLDKTTVNLNIDMIGRSDSSRKKGDSLNYVYVVGDDKLSSDLRTISEAMNKKYVKMELDYKFNDPNDRNRIYFRSDHYNFARKGVPIIFYYDGMLGADYHRPTDTPDKINYDLLAKRARLIYYTAWEMANRNEMLKRDKALDGSMLNR